MTKRLFYDPAETPLLKRILYLFRPKALPVRKFPLDILLETVAGCNAKCVFCPNGNGSSKIPPGRMDWELFRKIIDESTDHSIRRISPYLMNEPLLDRDLGKKIRYIAERRRHEFAIKINTNASLLDEEMARSLIGSGLDRLHFSCHGISRESYEESMQGLSLEKTLANIDRFLNILNKNSSKRPKVAVTMVRTKLIEHELPRIKTYWEARGVSVHIRPLENRANHEIGRKGFAPLDWTKFSWCKRLFTQANILTNGDMILCCVDYGYTTVLGNVGRQSIKEIWNSEKTRDIRRRFLSGKTEGLLCHSCMKQA
jgi:MoaA/NifB/PqqE/SkfB family radical SAM enzyme